MLHIRYDKAIRRPLLNRTLFILLITLLPAVQASGQSPERERVYLQTDKQLYLAGEPLWMKLYTTDADGRLTSLSKTGYVELMADSTAAAQVMLGIANGAGAGCMELPPTLPTGYYRLSAYTRYMRNEGKEAFFEKTIAVINPTLRSRPAAGDAFAPAATDDGAPGLITSDRRRYARRSRGELRIEGLPAEYLSLAVSIAGVDPPFAPSASVVAWKEQITRQKAPVFTGAYTAEYEGAIVEGQLIDVETNQPAGPTEVGAMLSFPADRIHLYGGQTDRDGRVRFFTASPAGRNEAVTAAFSYGAGTYRIDLASPFVSPGYRPAPSLRLDSAWRQYIETRLMSVQMQAACAADSLDRFAGQSRPFRYTPSHSYLLDDYTRFDKIDATFTEFIPQARIIRTPSGRIFNVLMEGQAAYATGIPLILLDDIPVTDHEQIIAYNPHLIKKLDVYPARFKWGGLIFDGLLSFETFHHNSPGFSFGASTQSFDYKGARPFRHFYAPAYPESAGKSRLPDFRHTLLWEPFIESRRQASIRIPFYTSDLAGEYLVVLEGVGSEGTAIRSVCRITVE
jgi:hypothetical protein